MPRSALRDDAQGALPDRSERLQALLDCETAAPYLSCTPRMVRKLVETRQLDSVRVGRLVRIEPEAIERFKDANRREAV